MRFLASRGVTSRRVSHIGIFTATTLLLAALVFPQTIDSEKSLFLCLPAYGAIAIALLVAAATVGLDCRRDIFCLIATLMFVGYIIVRALTSPAAYVARADLYCVLTALTVYGLTVSVINSAAMRLAVLVSLLVFAVFHVLVGLVQFGIGENFMVLPFLQSTELSKRSSGLYVDPDHLAGLLEVLGILGLSVACWSRLPGWMKVVVGYLTLNCYVGAALTGSRGGYISIIVSLIVFAGLSAIVLRADRAFFSRRYGAIGLIVLTAALASGGFLIHQSPALSERVANIAAVDQGRLDMWRAAIEQWKLAPVFGTGSGTYLFYGRQFRVERMQMDPIDVHNDYLHLLCEYGAAGAAGFLFFLFAHCRHGWRSFICLGSERVAAGGVPLSDRLALNIGALSAIGAYVVHSVVDFNLHIPANDLLLAFVFGVVANPGIEPRPGVSRSWLASPVKFAFVASAVILLVQCARLFPGEYYAEHARDALEEEEPSSAVSYANEALKWEQQDPNVFFYLGRASMAMAHEKPRLELRSELSERALTAFEKARRLVPLDGTYAAEIASVYDELGRFAEAEWMYGIARSRDPRSVAMSELYQNHLTAWENGARKRSW